MTGESEERNDALEAVISGELATLVEAYLGNAPTATRTYFTEAFVACLMDGLLTRAELGLAKAGRERAVRSIRRTYDEALRDDVVAMIERHTGREVVSFLSDQDVYTDQAIMVFILGSTDGHGRS